MITPHLWIARSARAKENHPPPGRGSPTCEIMEVTCCCPSPAWRHRGQRGRAGLRRADVRRTLASADRVAHAKRSAMPSASTQERAMAEALYAQEKLADAVAALATGSGRVRDRL